MRPKSMMIAAAKQAEAHDFILNLRDFAGRKGYDAYLGERGREAVGWAAAAHRFGAGVPERRADFGAG